MFLHRSIYLHRLVYDHQIVLFGVKLTYVMMFLKVILFCFSCKRIFCSLVQQASEKIDRTRGVAGGIFSKLLYHMLVICCFMYLNAADIVS